LEAQVPFGLDDVVIDYDVLTSDRVGSNVLAALVQRHDLEEHLALLKGAGLDPKVIDFAPLATLNVFSLLGNDLPATFAYVGGNSRRVIVALYRNGQLVGVRTLVPPPSAPEVDATASGNGHSAEATEHVESLVKEIRWTLLAINGAPLDDDLPCFVAGDGIAFDQMGPRLEAGLGVRVRRLEQAALRTVPSELRAELPNFVSPLGLALREVSANDALGVNFRQGEFAYHRGEDEVRRAIWRSGIIAALVVILMITNTYMGHRQLARRLELLQGSIRAVFTDTLPDVHRVVDEKSQLQTEIEAAQKKLQVLGGVAPLGGATAVDVMRTISTAIPDNLKIDIDEYVMDPEGVRIKAKSESFEAVDAIKQQIANTHAFADVQVRDVKAAPDGKGVDFRIVVILSKEGAGSNPPGQGSGSPAPAAGAGLGESHRQ
jgi:hypothetical protein